jgi:hypothetical protein
MKKHLTTLLFLFVLPIATLIAGGCKQLDLTPGLPEETQEGKGTFGCRVNGEIWLPYAEHTLDNAIEPEYDSSGWFAVGAEREKSVGHYIWLQLADSTGLSTKTYSSNEGFAAHYKKMTDGQEEIFDTPVGSPASITITKIVPPSGSERYAIISGTFSFTARSFTTGDSVRITDGGFDLKSL